MRRLFLAILILLSTITFAQTPSISALSFSLDNYGLYNNWHNQNDTIIHNTKDLIRLFTSGAIPTCKSFQEFANVSKKCNSAFNESQKSHSEISSSCRSRVSGGCIVD